MTERKYVMTRVRSGVYLLPSNDAQHLWKIERYTEDGSAEYVGADGAWHVDRGTYWQIAYWPGGAEAAQAAMLAADDPEYDFLWSDQWRYWAMGYRTRRDAVADALGAVPR